MNRAEVIAIAVAMGTPLETAAANYDAAFPPADLPGANDVAGGGREVRADGVFDVVVYGDGRREETLVS